MREDLLSTNAINTRIDDYVAILSDAKDRNFERWPDMLATNYSQVYVYDTHNEYSTQIKDWTKNKFERLDTAFEDNLTGVVISNNNFVTYEFTE